MVNEYTPVLNENNSSKKAKLINVSKKEDKTTKQKKKMSDNSLNTEENNLPNLESLDYNHYGDAPPMPIEVQLNMNRKN